MTEIFKVMVRMKSLGRSLSKPYTTIILKISVSMGIKLLTLLVPLRATNALSVVRHTHIKSRVGVTPEVELFPYTLRKNVIIIWSICLEWVFSVFYIDLREEITFKFDTSTTKSKTRGWIGMGIVLMPMMFIAIPCFARESVEGCPIKLLIISY